jgi:hypothetical protein
MVNNTKSIADDLHNWMYLTNVLKEIEGKMKWKKALQKITYIT